MAARRTLTVLYRRMHRGHINLQGERVKHYALKNVGEEMVKSFIAHTAAREAYQAVDY
jgi:hypothetical protein